MGITSHRDYARPWSESPPPQPRITPPEPAPKRPPHPNSGKRVELSLIAPLPGIDPAATPWPEFRHSYEAAALPAFAPATFALWRSAAKLFELVIEPQTIGALSLDMLDLYEGYMVRKRYSRHRTICNVSRVRHAIVWACDAGYLKPEAFCISPIGSRLRWPTKCRLAMRAA